MFSQKKKDLFVLRMDVCIYNVTRERSLITQMNLSSVLQALTLDKSFSFTNL